MGWGGGTEIFDVVLKELLKKNSNKEKLITNLYNQLRDQDWDNIDESEYYDDPFVKSILKKLEPDWFQDDVTVCFTGFRNDGLARYLTEECDMRVESSLTKDVTYLLVGKKSLEKGSSKIDKAEERGIWVGSVQEFLDEFDLNYEYSEE